MRYHIAGLTIEMSVSGRTAQQGAAYAAPCQTTPPDFTVSCDPAQILALNPQLETLDDAEYMGTGAYFAQHLLNFDGFQCHAAAVEYQGKAYLFSGPSGVGKSTLAARWQRLFGVYLLNDDKPALRRLDDTWYAYGTPWSGKWDKSVNRGAPLGGIAFLFHGVASHIEPLLPSQSLPFLLSQTPKALPLAKTVRMLELADLLLKEIPIWRLTCQNDDSDAMLAKDYMVDKQDNSYQTIQGPWTNG